MPSVPCPCGFKISIDAGFGFGEGKRASTIECASCKKTWHIARLARQALKSGRKSEERRGMIAALRQYHDVEVIELLAQSYLEQLEGGDEELRQWAIMSLAEAGRASPSFAATILLRALAQDEHEMVRFAAARGLGDLGPSVLDRTIETLIGTLKDKSNKVRDEAARVLGILGNARAVDALIDALKQEPTSFFLVAALGKIGDPRAIPFLVQHLQQSKYSCSSYLGEALSLIGWIPTVPSEMVLLAIASRDFRKAENVGAQGVESLVDLLRHQDPKVRSGIAEILGRFGDSHSVAGLVALLIDEVWSVREVSRNALARLKWQPGNPAERVLWEIGHTRYAHAAEMGPVAVGPLLRITANAWEGGDAVRAIEHVLRNHCSAIDAAQLLEILALTNVTSEGWDESTNSSPKYSVDCSKIKALAATELSRRTHSTLPSAERRSLRLTFSCECGKVYNVDRMHAGKRSTCRECRRELIVPNS